jgi:hypothetical protein
MKLKICNFSTVCAHEIKIALFFKHRLTARDKFNSAHDKCHKTQEIRNFMRVSNLYTPAQRILAVMCDQWALVW